jgi:hypothetical protein
VQFVHRSHETLQRSVKTLSGAFALNQWRSIPFGRTLPPLKTTSVNRKGFPENPREEKLLYAPPRDDFGKCGKLLVIVENFLIQCGKVENFCGKVENYHIKVR